MRRLFRQLITVSLVAAGSLSLMAQAPADQSKAVKIERMMRLTRADAMVDQMFDMMKNTTIGQPPLPGESPEARQRRAASQEKLMGLLKSKMSMEAMLPRYVKLYSETFSDSELDGIIAFYESPAGRAMLDKMPALMTKMVPMIQDLLKEMMPEIDKLVKEELRNSPAPR